MVVVVLLLDRVIVVQEVEIFEMLLERDKWELETFKVLVESNKWGKGGGDDMALIEMF